MDVCRRVLKAKRLLGPMVHLPPCPFSIRCATSAALKRELELFAWLIRADSADDMQIVHPSTIKGLFVLSFILFCSWVQSFTSMLELNTVWRSTFCASVFYLLSLFPPPSQPPPLPLLYLFITDSSNGVDVVSFQALLVSSLVSRLQVASRERPAGSGPRWPPCLHLPLRARADLRPLKPLAHLWPFWTVTAHVARRLWCKSQTMKMISPRRYSKKARGWVRWLRANTHTSFPRRLGDLFSTPT